MVLQGRPCGRLGRRRPPGRVARARGGEARTERLGEGDPMGPPFRLRGGAFPPAAKKRGRRRAHVGQSAAFCISLIRIVCFWRAGGSEGDLWFDALSVQSLRPQLLAWPRARCQPSRLWWANLQKGALRLPRSLLACLRVRLRPCWRRPLAVSDSNSAVCGCLALVRRASGLLPVSNAPR